LKGIEPMLVDPKPATIACPLGAPERVSWLLMQHPRRVSRC
jgi:hypothetical protein